MSILGDLFQKRCACGCNAPDMGTCLLGPPFVFSFASLYLVRGQTQGALNVLCTTCLVTNHSPFQMSAHLCTTALPWRLNQRCETEAQHEPPNNIISHIQKSSSRIVMFCEELICETDIVDLRVNSSGRARCHVYSDMAASEKCEETWRQYWSYLIQWQSKSNASRMRNWHETGRDSTNWDDLAPVRWRFGGCCFLGSLSSCLFGLLKLLLKSLDSWPIAAASMDK